MVTIPVMRRDHYDADNDGVVDESGASPLSDDSPQALGTANAGSGSSAARSDHVHAMPNRARGAYDAIVYIQDGEVIAEDSTGAEIESGTAGTDDSTIIQAAIDSMSNGLLYVTTPTTITLNSTITLKKKIILQGNCAGRVYNSTDYPFWIVNTPIGVQMGDGVVVSNFGYNLRDIIFRSAGSQTNTAIRIQRAHYVDLRNLSFYNLNKAIDISAMWTSTLYRLHGWGNNYGLYFTPDATYNSADLGAHYYAIGMGYNYSIYVGPTCLLNSHFYGGIIENSGVATGECIYIDSGNTHNRFDGMYLYADGSAGKKVLYDAGHFTELTRCLIYSGYLYAGYHSRVSLCEFRGSSRYETRTTNASINNCTFSGTGLSSGIRITQNAAEVSDCKFSNCNSQHGIYIAADNALVSGGYVQRINNADSYSPSYPIYIASGDGININNVSMLLNPNADGMIYVPVGSDAIIRHCKGYITDASGTSTGTGSEQTIAHGLVSAPSKVAIVPTETGATVSAVWADGTNIYCTVTTGKAFNWSAEV